MPHLKQSTDFIEVSGKDKISAVYAYGTDAYNNFGKKFNRTRDYPDVITAWNFGLSEV